MQQPLSLPSAAAEDSISIRCWRRRRKKQHVYTPSIREVMIETIQQWIERFKAEEQQRFAQRNTIARPLSSSSSSGQPDAEGLFPAGMDDARRVRRGTRSPSRYGLLSPAALDEAAFLRVEDVFSHPATHSSKTATASHYKDRFLFKTFFSTQTSYGALKSSIRRHQLQCSPPADKLTSLPWCGPATHSPLDEYAKQEELDRSSRAANAPVVSQKLLERRKRGHGVFLGQF